MRAMRAPLGYFDELCVALEHRLNPRALFVIFTAYFDEADTHGPEPTIIMAAFLGHAYQWRRFTLRLSRIQAQFGFRIFHAKDIKAKAGEFRGWSNQKCVDLVGALSDLVADTLTDGVVVHLEHTRYANEYRGPPIPKKMALDSHYGACFRACMAHIFDVMTKRDLRDKLHVVMEHGHHNVWDCDRILRDMQARLHRRGIDHLGTFTTEEKRNCLPLMVSDLLASTYSMMRAAAVERGVQPRELPEVDPVPDGKAGLTYIELQPDALRHLKENFEADRQEQIAHRRAEWEAKRSHLSVLSGGRVA